MSSHSSAPVPSRRQAFSTVLAIEFWERYGYYGMQAVLLLFMVQHLALSESQANLMWGAFGALTYITPAIGGYVGDRVLGTRPATLLGAGILAVGYVALAGSATMPWMLFLAMGLISTGNGLFKPNAGNLVREIYAGDDAQIDAAFTLYYMSVNVGAGISMLLTPWIGDHVSPGASFLSCAAGLVLGLVYYAVRRRQLAAIGSRPADAPAGIMPWVFVLGGAVLVTGLVAWILSLPTVARDCVWTAFAAVLVAWGVLYSRVLPEERPGLKLSYLLCVEGMLYFIFYQQMLTSLTLFALHAVSGTYRIGGVALFSMSAGQFQSLNSLWIIVASPVMAWLYTTLGRRGRDLTLSQKLAAGFVCVTLAFLVWWFAAATADGLVSPWYMVLGYGLLSVGELLISGLGLAVVARYAPVRFSGFMMGSLYLLWGIAMYVGSMLANLAAIGQGAEAQAAAGAGAYAPLFRDLFAIGCVMVVLFVAVLPLARRWEREHESVIAGS